MTYSGYVGKEDPSRTEACAACAGDLVVDPFVVQDWVRKLFAQHPDWSAKRLKQRAVVETLKGRQP